MDSHDTNASSSSRFLKTVCLHDWWLIKAEKDFQGKRLAVAGLTSRVQQAVRVFSSAPISKRYDIFTLETADGMCIVINGFINKLKTKENGFSSEVFSHFLFGFPPSWEEYAEKYLGEENTSDVSRRNSDFDKLTMDSGSMKNASPTIMLSFLQEETPNKYKRAITEERHDNSEDILDETNVQLEDNENILLAKNHSNIHYGDPKESSIKVQIDCTSQNVSEKIVDDASKGSKLQNHGADLLSYVREKLSVHMGSGVSTLQDKGHPSFTPSPVNVNVDSMKNDASENYPLSIGSDVNTVHSFEVNIALEPSRHHVTSRRMDSSKSNMKGSKRTMGKSKSYDVDNANPSNVDQAVSVESSAKRKLEYKTHVSPLIPEGKKKTFIISPESMSFKRSRSGRLLVPTLDYWRNQLAIYDADRQITGILDPNIEELSRGSKSQPQKKRKAAQ